MLHVQHEFGLNRYFIHFTSADDSYEDVEGVDLADDVAAFEYAILDARYLMDEGFADRSDWPGWSVEVVDEAGQQLFALTFTEIEAWQKPAH